MDASLKPLAAHSPHTPLLPLQLINVALKGNMVESDDEKMRIIGIVDIFGFEVFKLNSLEQLCINFANEKLQALFTKAVFLETIEAYKADGIDADAITYTDNATLIELFDAPKVGLWATLSEECVVPKGSDEGFTEKLHQAQKGSKVMLRVKGRSRDPRSHAPHSPYPHR